MAIQVTITLSVDFGGDDYQSTEPTAQRVALATSPAQVWQYQLQGPADNYLLISQTNPPAYLWIDPMVQGSGATFVLKGSTMDVGIPLSSVNPSLIPVASTTPIGMTAGSGGPAPQYQVDLQSSLPVQIKAGWF